MTLCIKNSGTYRNILTLCINESGTYRNITSGCINQSGTYRCFKGCPALGSSYEGGFLICCASPLRWIVAPCSAEVSRNWYGRGDANARAGEITGCGGWFIPTVAQWQDPGHICRQFFGPSPCYSGGYWTDEVDGNRSLFFYVDSNTTNNVNRFCTKCARSFRTVTY